MKDLLSLETNLPVRVHVPDLGFPFPLLQQKNKWLIYPFMYMYSQKKISWILILNIDHQRTNHWIKTRWSFSDFVTALMSHDNDSYRFLLDKHTIAHTKSLPDVQGRLLRLRRLIIFRLADILPSHRSPCLVQLWKKSVIHWTILAVQLSKNWTTVHRCMGSEPW